MTSVFPKGDHATVVSFCASEERGYYQPYNEITNPLGYRLDSERDDREHELLKQAIAWLDSFSDLPGGEQLDRNGDGEVDSIMFIVSGDADGWSSLLWPHKWDMFPYQATLNGKQVGAFSFQLQNTEPTHKLSTYCHETMHMLGFPDLYRYYAKGDPINEWDVMSNNLDVPQYANAYMRKTIADWGPAIQKAHIGENTVRAPYASGEEPLSVAAPLSSEESLVFEYRKSKANTFEQGLKSSGLLPYRIRTTAEAAQFGNGESPAPIQMATISLDQV